MSRGEAQTQPKKCEEILRQEYLFVLTPLGWVFKAKVIDIPGFWV
ncbi:hypothetical protein [Nostoc parmelioides]|nr:hypothetical protein [Nostoc parmelioides]